MHNRLLGCAFWSACLHLRPKIMWKVFCWRAQDSMNVHHHSEALKVLNLGIQIPDHVLPGVHKLWNVQCVLLRNFSLQYIFAWEKREDIIGCMFTDLCEAAKIQHAWLLCHAYLCCTCNGLCIHTACFAWTHQESRHLPQSWTVWSRQCCSILCIPEHPANHHYCINKPACHQTEQKRRLCQYLSVEEGLKCSFVKTSFLYRTKKKLACSSGRSPASRENTTGGQRTISVWSRAMRRCVTVAAL